MYMESIEIGQHIFLDSKITRKITFFIFENELTSMNLS